jgi:UDP-N-acetylmuramate dehydrogenase
VGATPIQNVGAYGQDVSETVTTVRALDTRDDRVVTLAAGDCGFGYRDSLFKSREPSRYIVLSVTYRLRPGGAPAVRYADVEQHLGRLGLRAPSLAQVRQSVLAIRRAKSMVLDDPSDANRRSCGSFFMNPVVEAARARALERLVPGQLVPQWPAGDGRVKLSAAWLIEQAGFRRGDGPGPVGLSTRHSLAIVAREGARARDVVDFARRLQAAVQARFGICLTPEPVFWGIE